MLLITIASAGSGEFAGRVAGVLDDCWKSPSNLWFAGARYPGIFGVFPICCGTDLCCADTLATEGIVIGNQYLDQLVASAPVNRDTAKVDWAGISALLAERRIGPSGIVAVSWCSFGFGDIESLVDEPGLAMVHHQGVLSSTGMPTGFGGPLKFQRIDFNSCRRIIEAENASDHGSGKCCIEFLGPGGVLLGRLRWNWRVRRFRDTRTTIATAATERDRIMKVIKALAL
jgi:hypothetical protein